MAAGNDSTKGGSDVSAQEQRRELVITRLIDAPRSLVFKAWTQPEHITCWWGPRGFITIHCEMDVRVGGTYRVAMRSPEGTTHWKRGIYREIVEPERIMFTFAWENPDNDMPRQELLTTVTFEEAGSKTRLTLRQGPFAAHRHRDSHGAGWRSTLERFAEYLARQLAPLGDHSNGTSDRVP